MSTRLAAVAHWDNQRPVGPMHRSIVAIDLEGSTTRTNPVKGELRRSMYELLGRALEAVPITENQLEQPIDRGDGVLLLIRPYDDVPKTVLLDRLIPALTALLTEHNTRATQPTLRMRLRAVVHAGEVHSDDRGFYGEAIDIAIRLLDSAAVKRALKQTESPLVLVVSEEIYSGIIAHGYVDDCEYRQAVRVRVTGKQHRGWVHVPGLTEPASAPGPAAGLAALARAPFVLASVRKGASGMRAAGGHWARVS
jgi:hypothetical protein